MKRLTSVISFAIVISLVFSFPGFAAEARYAYVDVARLFDEYQRTKDNDKVLQELGKQKESSREKMVKGIRALKDELVLLSEDTKEKQQDSLDEKVRQLQDFDRDAKRELARKRNKLVRDIFKDIDEVVNRFGERKGYDMILNERALLYRHEKYDVTNEILVELNKAYKK